MPLISLSTPSLFLPLHWNDTTEVISDLITKSTGPFPFLATCALSIQHNWPFSNIWVLNILTFWIPPIFLAGSESWFADPFFPRLYFTYWKFLRLDPWSFNYLYTDDSSSVITGPALETEWPTWHFFPCLCVPRALQTHFVNFSSVSPHVIFLSIPPLVTSTASHPLVRAGNLDDVCVYSSHLLYPVCHPPLLTFVPEISATHFSVPSVISLLFPSLQRNSSDWSPCIQPCAGRVHFPQCGQSDVSQHASFIDIISLIKTISFQFLVQILG